MSVKNRRLCGWWSLFWGRERKKCTRKRLPIATASVQPPSDTCGQRKASHRMKTISERVFPRRNPLVHLRAVSLPARARKRDVQILSPPPSANKKFRGVSEKSRERTLTMLDRPWRYLSGENPIRLQNPLRIEICFDVRNVNNVCAMCADLLLFSTLFFASRLFG